MAKITLKEYNKFLDDFEKFVAGIIAQSPHSHRGVPQRNTLVGEQLLDARQVEATTAVVPKVVLVAVEDEPHYSPHVVDSVGIIELHSPSLALGREGAQHEDARLWRHEW